MKNGFKQREAARNNHRDVITANAVESAQRLQAANTEQIKEINELRGKVRELQMENNDLRSVIKMLEADIKAFRAEYPAPVAVLGIQVASEPNS